MRVLAIDDLVPLSRSSLCLCRVFSRLSFRLLAARPSDRRRSTSGIRSPSRRDIRSRSLIGADTLTRVSPSLDKPPQPPWTAPADSTPGTPKTKNTSTGGKIRRISSGTGTLVSTTPVPTVTIAPITSRSTPTPNRGSLFPTLLPQSLPLHTPLSQALPLTNGRSQLSSPYPHHL